MKNVKSTSTAELTAGQNPEHTVNPLNDISSSDTHSYRMSQLVAIKDIIKNPDTREEGFKFIKAFPDDLDTGCAIYKCYVEAKYWLLKAKANDFKDVEALMRADDALSEAYWISKEEDSTIKSSKIQFTIVYVKYRLALHSQSAKARDYFKQSASYLTNLYLQFKPENKSLNWLANELLTL